MPDPRIKDEDKYEALRAKGYSKEKSARIANTSDSGKKAVKQKSMRNIQNRSFTIKQRQSVSRAHQR